MADPETIHEETLSEAIEHMLWSLATESTGGAR